jgi:hypothetical protein
MSVPTGFSVSGSPITSAGTLAVTFASGYALPTTVKQSNWDDAYTFVSNFPSQTGNNGKFLYTSGSVLSWQTALQNPMTALGDMLFGGVSGAVTVLPGNQFTTRAYLQQVGTGSGSAAPTWGGIVSTDISGQAITRVNDTNVTLTLTGTPGNSVLNAVELSMGWTGQLAVNRGGSGASTLTGVLVGNGTSAFTAVAGTAGQYLRRNSSNTDYEFRTLQGGDIAGSELTFANDTNVTMGLSGTPASALLQPVQINLGWTGQLAVARGGTGASTLTGVLIGNGTSAVTAITGTANQILRRNSGNTAYEFWSANYLVNPMTLEGSIIYADTGGTPTELFANNTSTNKYLRSVNGTAPAWVEIPMITGSGVSGQVTYWTGTSTQAGNNNLFWDISNYKLGIGNSNPLTPLHVGNLNVNNSDDAVILISRNVDNTVTGNGHAFSDSSNVNRSGIASYNSFDCRITFIGTQSYGHYAGFQAAPVYSSTGSMDDNYNYFSIVNITSGTITNHYAVYAANPYGSGTLVNNYGVYVANLTKGTNIYGIYSNVSSASNSWNIYANGTASNYFNSSIGIASTSLTGNALRISKNITGSVNSYNVRQDGQVQSDVTSNAAGFLNQSNQVAGASLTNYRHFWVSQGTISGTITNQAGYFVDSSLTSGLNNYAFYGDIPSGTDRWNLFMNGTANNYLAGNLGIGSTSLATVNLNIAKNITGGTTAYGQLIQSQIQNAVTSIAYYFRSFANTQATSFTLTNLFHFRASQGTFGAGSAVTNQYGFEVEDSLTGATNNYGFYGNIAAATGRWNIYINGSANNYIAGNLGIGTNNPVSKLDVSGSVNISSASYITWGGAYGANIPAISGTSGTSGYLSFSPTGSSSGEKMRLSSTGQLRLNGYTSTSSFSGLTIGLLGFTSTGAITTYSIPSGVSGTQDYLAKFDSTGVAVGNSRMIDNGTNFLLNGASSYVTGFNLIGDIGIQSASGQASSILMRSNQTPTSGTAFGILDAYAIRTGSTYQIGGGIEFRASQNWNSTSAGTNIFVQTAPDNTVAPADMFVFLNNGAVRFIGRTSNPLSPAAGTMYYNSSANNMRYYNGTTWITF